MDGHSRSGAFGEDGGSECDDPFGRMRNFGSLGRGADMFSQPAWGGFSAHGAPADSWSMDDPMDGVEAMRPRQRPKFSSATTMMGPRPFRRERRASAGPAEQPAADGGQPGRERIIPIRVEQDETDSAAAAAAQQQEQPPQRQPSPRQQRPYVRRGTMDTPVSSLQTEELQRDARARSAPPEAEPKAAAARVPPLNVQAAAAAATPHKPNYFNSSPKPFSAQQRPFQTPSFGAQGQIPIPVKVERGPGQQQHPHQHQQQQQQQQPEEPKQPPPPPPKPKSPKERAMETIAAVQERVAELGGEVEGFAGQRGERQHLYLDEMLTRELLKLDNVEANGDDEIRTSRKQTIMSIQKCLAQLEAKVTTPEEVAAKAAQAEAGEAETPMETAEDQPTTEGTEGAGTAGEVGVKSGGEVAQPPAAETEPAETAAPPPPQEAAGPPAPAPAVPDEAPVPTPSQDTAPAPAPAAGPEGDPAPAPAAEASPAPEATPAADTDSAAPASPAAQS